MKILPIIFIACLAMACSQQKSISKQKAEPVHRYSTIYQGNRVITYQKELPDSEISDDAKSSFMASNAEINTVLTIEEERAASQGYISIDEEREENFTSRSTIVLFIDCTKGKNLSLNSSFFFMSFNDKSIRTSI